MKRSTILLDEVITLRLLPWHTFGIFFETRILCNFSLNLSLLVALAYHISDDFMANQNLEDFMAER